MSKKRAVETVNLADLVELSGLQVRAKIHAATVKKYRHAIAAGADFPPLEVALCGGALWLLDGFHRKAAYEACGRRQARAHVVPVDTLEEARWLAAKANLKHGLPLKAAERRSAFHAYMEAGQNHKGGYAEGELKSYREMGVDLGGMPFSTIRNWMKADYPETFEAMGGGEDRGFAPGGLGPSVAAGEIAFREVDWALDAALAALPGVRGSGERAALLAKAETLKATIEWASAGDAPEQPF